MLINEAIKYEQNIELPENLIVDYKSQEIENKFRIERDETKGLYDFNLGIGYEYVTYNNNTTSRIFTNTGPQILNFQSNLNLQKYYAFGSISRKLIKDKLSVTFGFRLDGNSYSDDMANPLDQFSPRLAVSYSINPNFSVNANLGRYFQLPPYTVLGV